MDFSTQLDALQQHVADTKSAAQAAASESRDQLRQRIDQAQVDMNLAVKDAKQQAGEAAASARSKWAQMKTDAAARMDDLQAKIDKRAQQLDARAAASLIAGLLAAASTIGVTAVAGRDPGRHRQRHQVRCRSRERERGDSEPLLPPDDLAGHAIAPPLTADPLARSGSADQPLDPLAGLADGERGED